MASRKSSAVLRTIDLFSGKTALEEASTLLEEEERDGRQPPTVRAIVPEAQELAERWLGQDDAKYTGDDVQILVSPKGQAVILLIDTAKSSDGSAYATRQFKLSKAQFSKLKKLCRQA